MWRNPQIGLNQYKIRNKAAILHEQIKLRWSVFLENMNVSILIPNQTAVFVYRRGVCLCVCLATGFLTLQVQLPVLRPHLRRGITAYYSSTNNSLSAH